MGGIYFSIVVIVSSIICAATILSALIEVHYFKKGTCKKCGEKLDLLNSDSLGGRHYKCSKCDYSTMVTYMMLDKKYLKEMGNCDGNKN